METIGKYQILGKIGAGGFAVVYKGHDPFLKRPVAIKICFSRDEETRQRFFREAEIAGALVHRNITTIYDFGVHERMPYLVEEYLSGEDLAHSVKRHEPQDLGTRIQYLLQIAEGLEYAHLQGVIHRDIKPGNVRILDSGVLKLMDFGTAKLADVESSLTQSGMTLGTVAYLSPERLLGRPSGLNSDLFSYGVLAYELLSFERPFTARKIPDLIDQVLHLDPTPLDEVWEGGPPELARIVARALEKDPAQRYGSTSELLADLRAVAQSLGVSILPTETDTQILAMPPVAAQVPGLLDRAVELFAAGKVERARVLLDEVLDIEPEHADALALRSDLEAASRRAAASNAAGAPAPRAGQSSTIGDPGGPTWAGGEDRRARKQAEAVQSIRAYLDQGQLLEALEALRFAQRIFGRLPETPRLLSSITEVVRAQLAALHENRARSGGWIVDQMVTLHHRGRLDRQSAGVLAAWADQLLPTDPVHRDVLTLVQREADEAAAAAAVATRDRRRVEAVAAIELLLAQGDADTARQALDFALEKYGDIAEANDLRARIDGVAPS